jgi:hypothetical protein
MMAYNVDQFLGTAIDAVLPYVEQLCVVEGAWSPDAKSQRSTDDTIKILRGGREEVVRLYWEQMPPEMYRLYQCQSHRDWVKRALDHPFYYGPALQQQLMARNWGLHHMMDRYILVGETKFFEDPGWLWIVDADEIYKPEAVENLIDTLGAIGEDYDFFTINGKNFYFDGKFYHDEWYRRLFRIKERCFFSDDNSLETPDGPYNRTMNIPTEICEFYHYGYVGSRRVRKKLEMWRQDDVSLWLEKNHRLLMGEEEYRGHSVHLFGHRNPGYADYRLVKFEGEHPSGVIL